MRYAPFISSIFSPSKRNDPHGDEQRLHGVIAFNHHAARTPTALLIPRVAPAWFGSWPDSTSRSSSASTQAPHAATASGSPRAPIRLGRIR